VGLWFSRCLYNIGVGAKWVGGIQSRTTRNEKDIALFNKALEGHREISDKTNQAVGRIEGILELLISQKE